MVVGGGIIGCAAAYYLTASGLKVHLVERQGVATGTSGCSMGHLIVTPDPPHSHTFTYKSILLWQQLAEELGGIEYSPRGSLWLAENEEDLPLLDKLHATFIEQGDEAEILDAKQLLEAEPGLAPDLPRALHYPHDAVVMPTYAVGAPDQAAMAMARDVSTYTPVTSFILGDDMITPTRDH